MRVLVVVHSLICDGPGGKKLCPVVLTFLRHERQRMETKRRSSDAEDTDSTTCHVGSFKVRATVKPCGHSATETIGTVSFDKCNYFLATGGISRKIRVYKLSALLKQDEEEEHESEKCDEERDERRRRRRVSEGRSLDSDRSSLSVICTPSRLSSLQWRPGRAGTIACGDYDGVVTEWSVDRQLALIERDEHQGRNVWSVDYAKDGSDRCISASDDGTARIWDSGVERSVCVIRAPNSKAFCCAEFDPSSSSNLVALACADTNTYVHDLRRVEVPVWTLAQHKRPASYARFLGTDRLVTSSIDSSICVWNLRDENGPRVTERFNEHHNVKNFVGLSVWRGGQMVACGSETNQAYVYKVGGGDDKLVHRHQFTSSSTSSSALASAVCWMHEPSETSETSTSCTLAAANSDGILQILSGKLNSSF